MNSALIMNSLILNIKNNLVLLIHYFTQYKKKQSHFIKIILHQLEEYADIHFSFEERVMKECNFSDYKSHKKMHDEFKKKSKELVNQYQKISGDSSLDVLYFLKGWWTNHILDSDHKYKPFLVKSKYKETTEL
jgi:hemerythrin-like metal-binding protein